jgi:uncharacterized membrane protein
MDYKDIKKLVIIMIVFILVDLIWINFVAGPKYNKMIYNIQNEEMKIKILPALIVYVCMGLLLLFGSSSNIKNFLLGFLSYGVYDMTNLALINKFDVKFAIADMTWGGILFMVTYVLSNYIEKKTLY